MFGAGDGTGCAEKLDVGHFLVFSFELLVASCETVTGGCGIVISG